MTTRKKLMIRADYCAFGIYDGTWTIDEFVTMIKERADFATKCGFTDLKINMDERDTGDRWDSAMKTELIISGKRLETDKEFEKRLKEEERYKVSKEDQERREYEQYLALQAKYGKTI